MLGFGLAAYGSAGWMVCLAVSSIWVVLGWAFLHTKRSADQCYTLNPKAQTLNPSLGRVPAESRLTLHLRAQTLTQP